MFLRTAVWGFRPVPDYAPRNANFDKLQDPLHMHASDISQPAIKFRRSASAIRLQGVPAGSALISHA